MQDIYNVEYNNIGMDLNYETYDSLSSAKERFSELVSGRRYDMVLLCKKASGNKSPRHDRVIYRWDSGHDLNYPEFPDSWSELFERFE